MTAMIRVSVLAVTLLVAPLSWSKGSAEAGATKAATCLACHGANGNSVNPEWPSLAGQNAAYVTAQLRYYHNGRRVGRPGDANAALMPPMAATLTEQDIEDLAAYYSLQTPTGLETDAETHEAGRKLYHGGDRTRQIPSCAACHGPLGSGNPAAGYPSLRAQHSVYTIKQLKEYRDDVRYVQTGKPTGDEPYKIMWTITKRLTDDDLRNLASYIQGMR
jgi:cytochrome c553